jgi:alpha-tubulin suppressor-like RCC1 family protein
MVSFVLVVLLLLQSEIPIAKAEQNAGGWKDITVSGVESLGIKTNGTVWAWGESNSHGEFGNGEQGIRAANPYIPVQVKGLTDAIGIAAGYGYGLALENDGTVWTWGNFSDSPIDESSIDEQKSKFHEWNKAYPGRVKGLTHIVGISGGSSNKFAIQNDGTLWSWSVQKTLGINGTASQDVYEKLDFSNVAAVSSDESGNYIVLEKDGTVWSMDQQYGDPIRIEGLNEISAIALSGSYAYVLQKNGYVWEFGLVKGKVSSMPPHIIKGIKNVADIQATHDGPLILKKDGTVWTYGSNAAGELGIGTYDSSEDLVKVKGLKNITKIAASGAGYRVMALGEDGTLWSWGSGPVGDGTKWDRLEPVWIPSSSDEETPDLSENDIALKINGEIIDLTDKPLIQNETTLVPLRAISEFLGAKVKWEPDVITLAKDQSVILLTIGSPTTYVNGSEVQLTTSPVIINDTTYVPLRFIAETFDTKVEWDGNTQTVMISDEEYKQVMMKREVEKEQIEKLMAAVKENKLQDVKQLMENNEYSDDVKGSALLTAIFKNFTDICKYMVGSGLIDLNHPVKEGSTTKLPLFETTVDVNIGTDKARFSDNDLTRYFVLHGAKPDPETLGNVVAKGDIELVKFLLDHGGDPNGISNGISMLTIAKLWRNESVLNLLIQYGAKVEQ